MIDILMATYNGADYIENQLLSLIGQTHKDWRVLIHDDGSTDSTLEIVKRYCEIDSRIDHMDDGVVFGNAAQNFLHLLSHSKAPFVSFCDQDDIWFESKLELLLRSFNGISTPMATYCNAYGFDGIKIIIDEVTTIHRDSLANSLFLNSGVQGCSIMFNQALREKLIVFPKYVYMHDHLITIGAITFGKLFYLDLPLMFYRQHSKNVTGNISTTLKSKIKSFINPNNAVIDQNHFDANKSFYETYANEMTSDQRSYFLSYLSFPTKTFFRKVVDIFKYNFSIGNSKMILIIKFLIRKSI